ncbi:uncharacterized protein ASCRUDRAFT_138496 [Ascoidea rubescens DSM 1968]|uniref:Uncharacterized protein n=1 Tax=Ascoidea rubescens DSM 1968 TaxID=1344418 RepID=A0A1D2VJP4_9ASCO|nr:hypothetical protein ASCRUDRAFT_138496 [Ascoidea rubescens DSM 1968]ODV61832.1 hypothetical protein ASCRUDRAFT_138496 [Ascoidea rubescens DSM 1968]
MHAQLKITRNSGLFYNQDLKSLICKSLSFLVVIWRGNLLSGRMICKIEVVIVIYLFFSIDLNTLTLYVNDN